VSERARLIHHARVLLAQSRAFRLRGSPFALVLLEWAGNARRAALTASEPQQSIEF
jgi:hypothetical protein